VNKKKTPIVVAAGVLGLGLAQEAHHNADLINRPLVTSPYPIAQWIVWGHLPHGPEPEGPAGSVRTPWSIPASTTSSTATAVVLSTSFGPIRSTF
jgi:hypothetical protein